MTDLSQPRAAPGGAVTPSRTRSFTVVFLLEMWERFGYYGMTAVVVLYMVQRLGYTDDRANLTFGAFVAMTYAGPAIGGYLGDKVIGTRRMAMLGAAILAIGYATLATREIPALHRPGNHRSGERRVQGQSRRIWSPRCTRATRRRPTRPSPCTTWR